VIRTGRRAQLRCRKFVLVTPFPTSSLLAAALGRADDEGTQEQAAPATLSLAWDLPAKRLRGQKPKSSSGGLVSLSSTSLRQALCEQTNHPHYKSFICSLSPPFCQRICPLRCVGPPRQLIQHPAWEGKRWETQSRPRWTPKDSAGKTSFSPTSRAPLQACLPAKWVLCIP